MYANLLVTIREPEERVIPATKVLLTDDMIVVHEDLTDGDGPSDEEGPVHRFPLGTLTKIEADF